MFHVPQENEIIWKLIQCSDEGRCFSVATPEVTAMRERRRTSRPNLPKSVGWSSEVHRFDTSYFFPNVAATFSVDTSVLLDELVREIWAAQLLESKYDKHKERRRTIDSEIWIFSTNVSQLSTHETLWSVSLFH